MIPRDPSRHPSRRERMLALFDLLSGENEERLNAHLADCTLCSEWMAEARAELQRHEFTEHIPSSILARWRRVQPSMGPRERSLYERHLRSCGTCAEALSVVLGTSFSMAPAEPLARAPQPAEKRSWISWGTWGWSLAFAAAVILVLVFVPRFLKHGTSQPPTIAQPDTAHIGAPATPNPQPSVAPPTGTAKAPTTRPAPEDAAPVTIALAPTGRSAAFELRAQQRDVGGELLEIGSAGLTRTLRLRVPSTPLFDPSQPIEVRMVGPDDRTLAVLRTTPKDLASHSVIQVRPRNPWKSGDYRIELVSLTPPGPGLEPESVVYPFHMR
jgi:hypothetical protein